MIVLIGGAEAESAGLAAETVTPGRPNFRRSIAGVPLGLKSIPRSRTRIQRISRC